jgi:hypothetical protein
VGESFSWPAGRPWTRSSVIRSKVRMRSFIRRSLRERRSFEKATIAHGRRLDKSVKFPLETTPVFR